MQNFIPSKKKIIAFHFPEEKKKAAYELVVVPFYKDSGGQVCLAAKSVHNFPEVAEFLSLGDFKGDAKEIAILFPSDKKITKRLALVGLGEKERLNSEQLRDSFAAVIKYANQKKISSLAGYLPMINVPEESVIASMVEGMQFANYSFDIYKAKKASFVTDVELLGAKTKDRAILDKLEASFEGVNLAKDLVNSCADEITPEHLAELARQLAKNSSMKLKILGRKQLEKEKLGLILAVGRASEREPQLIILDYVGSKKKNSEKTVLIGKGVTYDTGGLNLKPTGSMETMRCDMGGAATVFGIMHALSKLKLPINVTAVIPTVENAIDAKSYKPGDVYTSYNGTSIEISNTDAEGRLILADAISYAVKNLSPTRIIDYATLTGAMVVALGEEVTGMMTNEDQLAEAFYKAGLATYERVWRLPIYEEYMEALKSDIADIKNAGDRSGGSITAALFLQKFSEKTPWIHFDIAGTAFISKERRYLYKGATGVGVRFTLAYLQNIV
jgi:leucyl aminopeptidase